MLPPLRAMPAIRLLVEQRAARYQPGSKQAAAASVNRPFETGTVYGAVQQPGGALVLQSCRT